MPALYARAMDRRDGEPERLRALVEGANWQRIGSSGTTDGDQTAERSRLGMKKARVSRLFSSWS